MSIIRKLESPAPVAVPLLTEVEALAAFNLMKIGKSINTIKHELFLPTDKLFALYEKMVALRVLIERIAKGEEIQTPEVTSVDAETGEVTVVTPAVYYASPTSLNALQALTLTVINTNPIYGMGDGIFQAASIESMINSFNYVIGEMVSHSNLTNNATFEWWKAQLNAE